jgi:TonB family protein
VSVELALDLVLNEVVEQARNATGATGAAVALFRDGELSCRASAGENAPDLGVRVDATSGLAGACFSTGEIQQCRDTETDARVNAEACRRLGVRSMLIAPLVDQHSAIGIIQVFSSWPNAFGKREISALQVLAGRIAENTREAEAGLPAEAPVEPPQQSLANEAPIFTVPAPAPAAKSALEENLPLVSAGDEKPSVIWSSILIVLVIATAIALGVVIGWRRAAKISTPAHGKSAAAAPVTSTADSPKSDSSSVSISQEKSAGAAKAAVPAGGLVVTEGNGKIVYRSPATAAQPRPQLERPLLHRVEPEYPEDAKLQHVQGSVVLDVQVLDTGSVGNVDVVSGDPLLTQAAVDAVKQWRYKPDVANGQGVESQTRVTVKFTLPTS